MIEAHPYAPRVSWLARYSRSKDCLEAYHSLPFGEGLGMRLLGEGIGMRLLFHILLHEAGGIVHLVVDDFGRVGGLLTRDAHIEPDALAVDRGRGVLRLELPLGQLLSHVALIVGPEAEFLGRVLADGAAHTLLCGKDATIVVVGDDKSYLRSRYKEKHYLCERQGHILLS